MTCTDSASPRKFPMESFCVYKWSGVTKLKRGGVVSAGNGNPDRNPVFMVRL